MITDTSAMHALAKYAARESLRGKGLMDTARKVFRFLVSFALAKIPNGDPRRIRAQLMQITMYSSLASRRSYNLSQSIRTKRNKTSDAHRGTLAAKLVFLLNYAGARAAKGPAFYRIVRKFVSARSYSARIHDAGLYPALAGTKAPTKGKLPRYRHTPGSYDERLTEDVATILAENWASAHGPNAKGIIGLAGFAFDAALPEVDRLLTRYLTQDIEKAAKAAGFKVPAAA
jgi:hypothetical protein